MLAFLVVDFGLASSFNCFFRLMIPHQFLHILFLNAPECSLFTDALESAAVNPSVHIFLSNHTPLTIMSQLLNIRKIFDLSQFALQHIGHNALAIRIPFLLAQHLCQLDIGWNRALWQAFLQNKIASLDHVHILKLVSFFINDLLAYELFFGQTVLKPF